MSLDRQALPEMLTRLHLTAIRDQLDSLLDEAAKREFSLREAVAFLCEREVGRRNERRITSNRSVGEWGGVFGDPVVATAILDRLLHHSQVITIRGDSYRLREKRRSGLIKPVPLNPGGLA